MEEIHEQKQATSSTKCVGDGGRRVRSRRREYVKFAAPPMVVCVENAPPEMCGSSPRASSSLLDTVKRRWANFLGTKGAVGASSPMERAEIFQENLLHGVLNIIAWVSEISRQY